MLHGVECRFSHGLGCSKLALVQKASTACTACYYYAWTGLFNSAFTGALLSFKGHTKLDRCEVVRVHRELA